MTQVLNKAGEPDEREISVRVAVPVEFVGAAMSELEARRGLVTGMEVQGDIEIIHAHLPASEYEPLAEFLSSAILARGTVERESR